MIRGRIVVAVSMALVWLGVIVAPAHAAQRFKEFSIPTQSPLGGINAGPDGNEIGALRP